ncbi:MAG: nucleotidyltransferase family protein, partial [Oscillospiraceae bacterium]|nr:nucleotidyltransferase family protein [Oscillospiraceae bacterium]
MNVAGIICEYNPFHSGHAVHIAQTRAALGENCAIVCCMSGNFVQRGEFAVMSKHARAESAILCGADLVTELPLPYALSSAERFALGGVRALDALGVCGYISFGSESGDIQRLRAAALARGTQRAEEIIRRSLAGGASYAASLCAAYREIPDAAPLSPSAPNDMLGVEYLRAIGATGAKLEPIAILRQRERPGHMQPASAIRRALISAGAGWEHLMPPAAADIVKREIAAGRAPVPAFGCEAAALSRLRALGRDEYLSLPGASDGAGERLMRFALREPTLRAIAHGAKTKRYVMS